MVLVLVTLYTATTTANITAVVLASTINGLPDLPGKSVVTWVDCELKTPSLSLSKNNTKKSKNSPIPDRHLQLK